MCSTWYHDWFPRRAKYPTRSPLYGCATQVQLSLYLIYFLGKCQVLDDLCCSWWYLMRALPPPSLLFPSISFPSVHLAVRFRRRLGSTRYHDTQKRFPHLANCLKYSMSFTVALFGVFTPPHSTTTTVKVTDPAVLHAIERVLLL